MTNDRCLNCEHYVSDIFCIAFPDGIPEKILLGEDDHSKKLPEQDLPIIFKQNVVR